MPNLVSLWVCSGTAPEQKGKPMQNGTVKHLFTNGFLLAAFVLLFGTPRCSAQETNALSSPHVANQEQAATSNQNKVPGGTILPVVLETPLSFAKTQAGQTVRGEVAQDVPLPDGSKVPRRSRIQGQVTQVTPGANGAGPTVALQFDKLQLAGQWLPIVTNLRAIAGFMEVQEAQIPTESPAEGSVYDWLPTTQIGGDSVYGVRGPVMSAENTSKVIGKSVGNGVLVQVSAKEGAPCRGEINNNNGPQALWVFSGDACGVYGIEHLRIQRAGRTDPKGTIVLSADTSNVTLNGGDGLLLRVN
jgi:hypothetical protein